MIVAAQPSGAEREHGPGNEDHDRSEQRPEVRLPAIAQGMSGVGGPDAASLSDHEQTLVAYVGAGVCCLGRHRGGRREYRGSDLGDRHADVGRQRNFDRAG